MRLRIIQTGAPALKITPCGRFTRLWRCRSFSKSPCQLASASDKAGVHESDIANDRGCLSFFRLHNRREDVRPRTWYDTPTGCRNSWPSRCSPQQRPYEQLEYTHRLITGWSWDRSDFNVILKDGRVVEFGHGETRNRSPQVVYIPPVQVQHSGTVHVGY